MPAPVTTDPLDIVSSTAEAAFATDSSGHIIIWNKAAEQLMGFKAARVLGRSCDELLCGKDIFGNTLCSETCCILSMARRREPIHHFEMDVRCASGAMMHASISIVVISGPRPESFHLVHILQPVSRGREADELLRRILHEAPPPATPPLTGLPSSTNGASASLTARELEVLRLMAEGEGTQGIADALFISRATARNHIQHILTKLDVHSKVEAVSLAFRRSLI